MISTLRAHKFWPGRCWEKAKDTTKSHPAFGGALVLTPHSIATHAYSLSSDSPETTPRGTGIRAPPPSTLLLSHHCTPPANSASTLHLGGRGDPSRGARSLRLCFASRARSRLQPVAGLLSHVLSFPLFLKQFVLGSPTTPTCRRLPRKAARGRSLPWRVGGPALLLIGVSDISGRGGKRTCAISQIRRGAGD